jgi:C4-dicarboxylate-specific signal transduction histidine kinase
MSPSAHELEAQLKSRHRGLHVVASLVIVVLAIGVALLWPQVEDEVVRRFGPRSPSQFLIGELLVLVALFVVYLWRRGVERERLVAQLLSARGRGQELEERLEQARSVLQASAQLDLDAEPSASLHKILQCVTEALRAERGVLWRQRTDGRPPEREAVFPSTTEPVDPSALAFEDEVARKVVARGTTLLVDESTDLAALGVVSARPRKGWKRLVGSPLVIGGRAVGALVLCNPDVPDDVEPATRLDLLEVFSGFAAGVLRNLREFQIVAKRNQELLRARELLCDHQRELAEIDAVATMSRVAKSLAHGLSSPITAIAGYVDVVLTAPPDALTLGSARNGLRREVDELKQRLQKVVDFTQSWRRSYGVVDLNQVVETVVALQAESLRARGVSTRFEPHAGLPFTVADPVRLRQVFLSLFSFVRGVLSDEAPAELRVRTLADAGRLRVHVDFPARAGLREFAAPLLDPHVEVALLARERNVDLPVAVSIVRDHQGDLEIESLADHHARIVVDLPVLSEAPETSGMPDASHESVESVLERVLGDPRPLEQAVAAPAAKSAKKSARGFALPPPPSSRAVPSAEHDDVPDEAAPRATAVPATSAALNSLTAGIDALFPPGEVWHGPKPTVVARRAGGNATVDAAKSAAESAAAAKQRNAEVEGVLSLFDEFSRGAVKDAAAAKSESDDEEPL